MPGRLESAEGNGRPAVRCHFTNNEVDAQVDKRDAEKPFSGGGREDYEIGRNRFFLPCF